MIRTLPKVLPRSRHIDWRQPENRPRLGIFLAVIGAASAAILLRNHIALQQAGYLGIGLGCPAGQRQHGPAGSPLATVCAAIAFLIPLYVELVAGSAETVGELPRYFLGYIGRGVVGEGRISQRLGTWMRQRGRLLLFLLAFLPNPVFRPGRCDRRGPEIAAGAFLGGGACRKDTEVGRLCLCLRL